jgi:acylphosphatase
MIKRVHILVSGRVQGVFFRASTQKRARELELAGWVRNLPDGRVEILVEGEEGPLSRFLDWVHAGPPGARVDRVSTEWKQAQGKSGFSIRY